VLKIRRISMSDAVIVSLAFMVFAGFAIWVMAKYDKE